METQSPTRSDNKRIVSHLVFRSLVQVGPLVVEFIQSVGDVLGSVVTIIHQSLANLQTQNIPTISKNYNISATALKFSCFSCLDFFRNFMHFPVQQNYCNRSCIGNTYLYQNTTSKVRLLPIHETVIFFTQIS